ncbi:MAG: mechanosensitive ion channel [Candidatus Omnitrophica bacterium]|nr:mechanosensitive ion channel [Candidatus Omnitrophota bacterium]
MEKTYKSKVIFLEISKKVLLPFLFFIILGSLYFIYRYRFANFLSSFTQTQIAKYIRTFFIINFTFLFQRVIGGIFSWYEKKVALQTKTRLDEELIPLLRRTAKIGLWVISLLIILPLFGVNITALVTTLGVGSLAIALAAQDTIANIIAGFMIMIDRPFRIGDRIKLPTGEEVTVLDIGIRRSKFSLDDQAIIIVPNLELSKNKIVNFTYAEEELKKNILQDKLN